MWIILSKHTDLRLFGFNNPQISKNPRGTLVDKAWNPCVKYSDFK